MKPEVIGIVIAHTDIQTDILRQVTRSEQFPAMPGVDTHIPEVGLLVDEPMQAVVSHNHIYTLTKGTADTRMVTGEVFGELTLEAVVVDMWSRMFARLNSNEDRYHTYQGSYGRTVYPGKGLSQKIRINRYGLDMEDITLSIHYIAVIGEPHVMSSQAYMA